MLRMKRARGESEGSMLVVKRERERECGSCTYMYVWMAYSHTVYICISSGENNKNSYLLNAIVYNIT